MVCLPGHLLPALSKATALSPTDHAVQSEADKPLTLTIVLKRDDQAGFERFLHELYDPNSGLSSLPDSATDRQSLRSEPSRLQLRPALDEVEGIQTRARLEESVDADHARHARASGAGVRRAHCGLSHRWPDFSRQRRRSCVAAAIGAASAIDCRFVKSRDPVALGAELPAGRPVSASAPDWEVTQEICFPFTPTQTPATVGILEAAVLAVRVDAAPVFETACLGFLFASGEAYGICSLVAQFDSSIWSSNAGCADFFNATGGAVRNGDSAARNSSAATGDSNLGKNPQKSACSSSIRSTPATYETGWR